MKRRYEKITNDKRKALIDAVNNNEGMKIKAAAALLQIPYENAKAIFRVYRKEMRTDKCKHRHRKAEDSEEKHENDLTNEV
jgi:transposase